MGEITFTDRLLMQQNELLKQVIGVLGQSSQPSLGFSEAPRPRYIYCNRSNNCLWYWLNDAREVVPIEQTALTCMVEKLEFKQVERRGKETWKMHLHVKADRRYILEAGFDSVFAKGVVSAIAATPSETLEQPVTIEVQPADSDEVLFCRFYAQGEQVFCPWDESTNWKLQSMMAVEKVASLSSRLSAQPVAEEEF